MPRSARSVTDAAFVSVMRADSVISSHTQSGAMPVSLDGVRHRARPGPVCRAGGPTGSPTPGCEPADGGPAWRRQRATRSNASRITADADRHDEPGLLGQVDELGRRDQAPVGVLPAQPAPRTPSGARGRAATTGWYSTRNSLRCRARWRSLPVRRRRTTDARAGGVEPLARGCGPAPWPGTWRRRRPARGCRR